MGLRGGGRGGGVGGGGVAGEVVIRQFLAPLLSYNAFHFLLFSCSGSGSG